MGRVVIVGAGPTGLALALLLARGGIAVTVVESRPAASGLFRGEALMASGLEALEALQLLPLGNRIRHRCLEGWSFWLNRQPLFSVDEPLGQGHACTLVDPDALVAVLGAELEHHADSRLLLGRSVAAPLWRGERIGGVQLADGSALKADLVVACDGRGSGLRRAAALPLATEQRPIDVLWFRLPAPASEALRARLQGRFHTVLGEEGSLGLYGSASGGVQLGWPLQPGGEAARDGALWRARWQRLCPSPLAEALEALPPTSIEGPLRLPVRVGLAESWWRPGLLLLGDAAHPMSPVRAQGTSMGLRDALVAARQLLPALRHAPGPAGDGALDEALAAIERRRRPEILRMQELQRREWQRGERLAHSAALRQLLGVLAPAMGPLLGEIWRRGQRELHRGLEGALTLP